MSPSFEAAKRLRAKKRKALDAQWSEYLDLRLGAHPSLIDASGGIQTEGMDSRGRPIDIIVNKPMSYEAFDILMGKYLIDLFGSTGEDQ